MSDRSLGEFVKGGFTVTLILVYLPKFLAWMGRNFVKLSCSYIGLIFFGIILNIFTGHAEDFRGPVRTDQIAVSGYASLDFISVVVTNDSNHAIDLLDMTCNGTNVFMRRVQPGESRKYSSYAINVAQGSANCQIDRLKS